jgi:hypothetical protein
MRDRRSLAQVLGELRLPRPEREAARGERRAEREMRRERDNQQSAARRAAKLEAEARRQQNQFPSSGVGGGPAGG